MTSRERVLKTLCFEEPDRVPVDLGGVKASGISVEAYVRVCRKLGITDVPKLCDARLMTAWVEEPILKAFHADVAPLDLSMVEAQLAPVANWVPRTLFSGESVLFPPGPTIGEEAGGGWNLPDAGGAEDIPDATLDAMARHSKEMFEGTEYALLGWGRSNVTLGRPSDWRVMLMTEPELCHERMGRSVDASIRCLNLLHQAVGDRAFAWGIAADDGGAQRGEFIKPELWAELIKPHYARLCGWIHANTPWKTFLHSCGSVYHLIPHFIEAGVDILNPIQASAANMDPARLKAEFGRKLVLWGGGCDTQRVLRSASPEGVRARVAERMAILKPGGGYVFNQEHNIHRDVPPENILALFDAAREFGAYR
ncbi:MAG: uroporphyrinogen decarboxylase family protein [Kiritimatiellia bacterium]